MRLSDLTKRLFDGPLGPGRVLFRVDAGRRPGLSFGHLERCHMLAQGLRTAWNTQVTFLMADLADGVRRAKHLGEKVVLLYPGALDHLTGVFDALVFDLPDGPSDEDLAIARRAGLRTVVLDDTNRPFPWADVILNSSILARPGAYPSTARLFLGPDYLILPEDFHDRCERAEPNHNGLLVLITFGGSDPAGLTVKVLSALVKMPHQQVTFQVVTGPGFTESAAVAELAAQAPSAVDVVQSPPDLLALMKQADLAVCAGGRTLYELHALGVPAMAIAGIDHEADQVRVFRERGLIPAGLDEFDETAFLNALQQVLQPILNRRDGDP